MKARWPWRSVICPFRKSIRSLRLLPRLRGALAIKANSGNITICFFEDQGNLERSGLTAKAAKLQLDAPKFEACVTAGKFKAQVQEDSQEGLRAGVNGTPGFFINGVFLSGAQPEAAFEKLIEEQLAAASLPKS
jgi:predicted DsbA family dithiol-disulfide isomerase